MSHLTMATQLLGRQLDGQSMGLPGSGQRGVDGPTSREVGKASDRLAVAAAPNGLSSFEAWRSARNLP